MVESPVPIDTPYVSAPTTPTNCSSVSNMWFHSVPTSPARVVSETLSSTNEDVNCKFSEFEFGTSRYFDLDGFEFEKIHSFEYLLDDDDQEQQQQCGGSQPAMAFADELFCDGLVLPLKLPPRLDNVNDSKRGNLSSTGLVLRLPFSRRTWNDGYDPFTAALENVKAERKDLACGRRRRRARSLSPLRTVTSQRSSEVIGMNPQASMPHLGPNADQPMQQNESACTSWLQFRNRAIRRDELAQEGGRALNMPAKTKGVAAAKRATSLRMRQERLDSLKELAGCTWKTTAQKAQETEVSGSFIKSASMDDERKKEKPRNQTDADALWKPPQSPRKWSFRKSVAAVHSCGKRRVHQGVQTIIHNRPSFFLCFGFGN